VRWAAPAIRSGGRADATEERTDATEEPGEPGEKRGRNRRTAGPALQGLIAFVIYLVGMVVGLAQPLLPHLDVPHVQQGQVDANFYVWGMGWWPYAISHWLNPLYSHQIWAPGGVNLAWVTTTPPVSLLMWPVTATAGPVASLNLTLILAPPASAWAAFILCRRLTGKFWPALLAGAVFGFCDYEISHEASGQPNLTVTVLLPLIAYLVLRWWDGSLSRRAFLIWTSLAFAAEFYTFLEAFADLTLIAPLALVIGFLVAARDVRPKVVRLAVDSAMAYVGGIVLAAPYLYYALRNVPHSFHQQSTVYWVDLVGVVVPRGPEQLFTPQGPEPNRLLGMSWLASVAGYDRTPTIYVGVPLLVLFVLVAVFHWSNRLIRLLVPLYVVIFLLALGPKLVIDNKIVATLPWGYIWSLPLLNSAESQRLLDFGQLILALVMAIWLAHVTASKVALAARWGLAVLSLFAIFANLPTFASVVNPPATKGKQADPGLPLTDEMPAFFTQGLYRQYLQPGENVVILSERGNAMLLFQAASGFYFNVAGGFINASLNPDGNACPTLTLVQDGVPCQVQALSSLPPSVGGQRVAAFKSYVREDHIGAILVERAGAEQWMYAFGKNGIDFKPTTVGGVTIFQVPKNYG
jgi:hypothetical protein